MKLFEVELPPYSKRETVFIREREGGSVLTIPGAAAVKSCLDGVGPDRVEECVGRVMKQRANIILAVRAVVCQAAIEMVHFIRRCGQFRLVQNPPKRERRLLLFERLFSPICCTNESRQCTNFQKESINDINL